MQVDYEEVEVFTRPQSPQVTDKHSSCLGKKEESAHLREDVSVRVRRWCAFIRFRTEVSINSSFSSTFSVAPSFLISLPRWSSSFFMWRRQPWPEATCSVRSILLNHTSRPVLMTELMVIVLGAFFFVCPSLFTNLYVLNRVNSFVKIIKFKDSKSFSCRITHSSSNNPSSSTFLHRYTVDTNVIYTHATKLFCFLKQLKLKNTSLTWL